MLPLVDALRILDSKNAAARLEAVRSIYSRHEFSLAERKDCGKYFNPITQVAALGAIYYIGECRHPVISWHLTREVCRKLLALYNPENLNLPVWTGTDYVAWEAAKILKVKNLPRKSHFIVTEQECCDDLTLFWPVLMDSDSFSEITDQCVNTFLMRSQFENKEIVQAQRLLEIDEYEYSPSICGVHVLMNTMSELEIYRWGKELFGEKKFERKWRKALAETKQRIYDNQAFL